MPDAQMKALLNELAVFIKGRTMQTLPQRDRNSPTAANAVKDIFAKQSRPAVEIFGDRSNSNASRNILLAETAWFLKPLVTILLPLGRIGSHVGRDFVTHLFF